MCACETNPRLSVRFIYYHRREKALNDLSFSFFSLQNLWYRASRFKASSASALIGRNTSADRWQRRLNSNTGWRARRTITALAAGRSAASVTIISGTSPARQAVRKSVFPAGKANTVQNVSVYLHPVINSFVAFVYYFISLAITIGEKHESERKQSLKFKYQSRVESEHLSVCLAKTQKIDNLIPSKMLQKSLTNVNRRLGRSRACAMLMGSVSFRLFFPSTSQSLLFEMCNR